jgi:hypothetical protein
VPGHLDKGSRRCVRDSMNEYPHEKEVRNVQPIHDSLLNRFSLQIPQCNDRNREDKDDVGIVFPFPHHFPCRRCLDTPLLMVDVQMLQGYAMTVEG